MKNTILLFIILVTIAFSCAQKSERSIAADEMEATPAPSTLSAKTQLATTPQTDLYSNGKTKLIKTANYRFQVDNVKNSTEAIEAALKKYPAYIASSNLHLENPILENKITIRIQNEYFHDLLKEIDQQAVFVNFRDVLTEDVSKDFVDLESRLKTKREVEARYMEILRKKAGTIEELLSAEQQIGELHEEIEATISRINYLREQVSYSTINLEFYQTIKEVIARHEENLLDKFSTAFSVGLKGLVNLTLGLAYIWPIIILGVAVLVVLKMKKRRNILKTAG